MAVIGFITILIMPTMISKFQDRAFNASATSFEASLGESLKVMNIKKKLAGHGTTENFVNELSRYMKITKICTGDQLLDCFADKVMWGIGEMTPEEVLMKDIKTSSSFGQKDWKTNVVGVQFANGTNAMIAYNPEAKQDPLDNNIITLTGSNNNNTGSVSLGTDTLAILYDTNGFRAPNYKAKDLRSINVQRLGSAKCAFEINGTCYGEPFVPKEPVSLEDCEAMKTTHGVPRCIPPSQSQSGSSHWLAAVKICGGVDKLPSKQQLKEIAEYVYDDGIRNDDKMQELGFHPDIGIFGGYTIWSSEFRNSGTNYYGWFTKNEYSENFGARMDTIGGEFVCIIE